jgi:hypothetical protein
VKNFRFFCFYFFIDGFADAHFLFAGYKWGRKQSADEEIRLGSEIDSAIQECKAILHDCQDEFSKLTATSVVGGLIMQINPPSDEEIRVVRALWQTYLESVGGIWKDGVKMVDEILFPPG